jgi:hypothetical protein
MVCVIEEVDSYFQYLIDKYFIFHELAELDEANTIDDTAILRREISMEIKKLTDANMISLTKQVFSTFRCYNIGIKDNSGGFGSRLNSDETEKIYLYYKKYKCLKSNSKKTNLTIKPEIDTKDTYYVDSLDTITTHQLQNEFGDFLTSGTNDDDFRYEYRFEFTTSGKKYKFSLYDYLNDDNEFYDTDNIYWHIASNTDKSDVVNLFKGNLIARLSETDCC